MDKVRKFGDAPDLKGAGLAGVRDSLFFELVERANDLFLVIGRDGRVQFVNQSFCHLTGFTRDEVQNERLVFLLDPKARQSAQKRLAHALQFGGQTAVELPLLSKSSGTVEISFRPTAERAADGSVERMILVGQSPLLYGELAEQFNNLTRDLQAHSTQLEKLNVELEDRIEERTARLAALLEVSASLNTELQLDSLFELVLRQATATIPGAEAGALLLHDQEADRLVIQAACGYHDSAIILDLQAQMERVHPQAVFSDRQVRVWSGETRAKSGQMKVLLRKTDQFRIRSALSAPIATPSEKLGILLLHNFDEPNAFTEDDVQLAASLAGSAAVAITNARLYDEARQQTARLELLNRLSAAVRDSVDLEQFFRLAVEGVARALDASRAAITLFDEAAETPLLTSSYSEPGIKDLGERATFLAGTPLMREALGFREPRALAEARYDPRVAEARQAIDEFGVESLVVAPLVVRDRFLGLLELHQCDRVRRWREAEIRLVESVSKQVAVAIHQNRLHTKLRQTVREAEALHRAANALIDTSDLNALLAHILAMIADEFGNPRSAILLLDATAGELHVHAAHGHAPEVTGMRLAVDGTGIPAEVARTRRSLSVTDGAPQQDHVPFWEACRSELAVPLTLDREVIGVLDLQSAEPSAFSERDQRILTSFAERIASAIRSAQADQQRRRSADRERLVSRITTAIRGSLDLRGILQAAVDQLGEALGASRCWFVMAPTAHVVSAPVACQFFDTKRGGTHVDESRILAVSDPWVRLHDAWAVNLPAADAGGSHRSLEGRARAASAGARSMLIVTVQDVSGPVGLFSLQQCDWERDWGPEEEALVRAVADQAAIAVRQVSLFEQVSRGKREWEATFDAMSDGVFIFDEDRRLRRVNAAASALEGRSFLNLLGSYCCTTLADPDGERCMVECVMASGEPVSFEWSPGETEIYLITINPLPTKDGRMTGVVAVVHDLSQLRQAERESDRHRLVLARLMENAHEAAASRSDGVETLRVPERQLSILVIDDEEAIRDVLAEMLEVRGHRVTAAASGGEGLEKLDVEDYDLVFTDLSMPGLDGWAVAREAKRRRPNVKIVLATGYGATPDLDSERLLLVDATLSKPFDYADVVETLRRVLGE